MGRRTGLGRLQLSSLIINKPGQLHRLGQNIMSDLIVIARRILRILRVFRSRQLAQIGHAYKDAAGAQLKII
jgi:HD-GYP domain-containing protein (c-di-GMP phosphodiesterase class II)